MNKKIKSLLPALLLLSTVLVIAGVAEYYASIDITAPIEQPITVNGGPIPYEEDMTLKCNDGKFIAGKFCVGDELFSVENSNDEDKTITVTTSECDEADIHIVGKLDMFYKDANWTETSQGAIVYYTFIGDEFNYIVESSLEDYVLVYYPDIDGNPGSWNIDNAILLGPATEELTSASLTEGLPISTDYNDEAKLWLIPQTDWDTQAWNPSVWLFEQKLITYNKNINGLVEVPAEGSIEFYLGLDVDEMAYDSCETTLTINTI